MATKGNGKANGWGGNGNGKATPGAGIIAPAPTRPEIVAWQDTMRRAVFEVLDPDMIRDIVTAMADKAKAGDIGAARLLLNYAVGSPTINVKNAMFVQDARAGGASGADPVPLPSRPLESRAGTPARVDELAERARNGRALFDPRDRGSDGGEAGSGAAGVA